MNQHNEKKLEELIHRELRKLPELRAPETLVHRVMLAVHAKERRPWWQRPWLTWPRPAQLISFVLCAATVAGLVYAGAEGWRATGIGSPLDKLGQWMSSLTPLLGWLATLANAATLVLQRGGQQFLLIGLAVAGSMYLLCVATGTACYRLAYNRR